MESSRQDSSHDTPFDFTLYLERRLGLSREIAERVLGEWLERFEPLRQAPIHILKVRGHWPRSRAASGTQPALFLGLE
jgi:hypothetical protein